MSQGSLRNFLWEQWIGEKVSNCQWISKNFDFKRTDFRKMFEKWWWGVRKSQGILCLTFGRPSAILHLFDLQEAPSISTFPSRKQSFLSHWCLLLEPALSTDIHMCEEMLFLPSTLFSGKEQIIKLMVTGVGGEILFLFFPWFF